MPTSLGIARGAACSKMMLRRQRGNTYRALPSNGVSASSDIHVPWAFSTHPWFPASFYENTTLTSCKRMLILSGTLN